MSAVRALVMLVEIGPVDAVSDGALSIVTTSLPDAFTELAYATTLSADGGASPYTWDIIDGDLPPGLSLDSGSGEISGNSSALLGEYPFTVQVTDANLDTATRALSINRVDP
jgi:hypothetical protein